MPWVWPDNLHSRLVFWLKIVLPLCAIAILSTLFLVSHNIRPEDAIPYADVDVADLLKEPRLTKPDFAGMTSDGAALSLTADAALLNLSGSASPGLITGLVGLLETPDGAHTDLAANEAQLDTPARNLILGGGVIISNSAGYRIETRALTVALDKTSIDSAGPVTATGPVGSISAGTLHLGLAGGASNGYVLLFRDGVRMTYLPRPEGTAN